MKTLKQLHINNIRSRILDYHIRGHEYIEIMVKAMGTGSFPGVKRPRRGADHPTPSKRRGHERVGLYFYSPTGPFWPVIGRTLPFLTVKAIPLQAWTGPEGSRRLTLSDFKTIGT